MSFRRITVHVKQIFEQYRIFNFCYGRHNINSEKAVNIGKSTVCDFLAHLSRRLTGELIGYPWIRRPSVRRRRPFTFSNIFSSETAWPIKAKFYVEPLWEGRTKVCIKGPGHMTKMAAMPIYGKNLKKIFFSRTRSPMILKFGM